MKVSRIFVGSRAYDGPWPDEDSAVASLFSDQLRGWREAPPRKRLRAFSLLGSRRNTLVMSISVERVPINVANEEASC